MKVEVDADELCQMKDRIRFLERDVCRRAAENAELACERPSGDKFRKLTAERDWWRERAMCVADSNDRYMFFSSNGLCHGEHLNSVKNAAKSNGYEIPE